MSDWSGPERRKALYVDGFRNGAGKKLRRLWVANIATIIALIGGTFTAGVMYGRLDQSLQAQTIALEGLTVAIDGLETVVSGMQAEQSALRRDVERLRDGTE